MQYAVAIAVVLFVTAIARVILILVARRRPSLTPAAMPSDALVDALRLDVAALCELGERSSFLPEQLHAAANWIDRQFAAAGYRVERQTYRVDVDNVDVDNVIVELRGSAKPNEIVVIGAHYDSVTGTIGADDNASGIAALLALARQFAHAKPARCARAFRARTTFPIETASLPEAVTGIGWSDQWSFWQFGWPAVMVTDTAPFRNPHYHEATDRPETLDYARLAQVVEGLAAVIEEIVR